MSPISKRITVKEKMSSEDLQKFMRKHGLSEDEFAQILGLTPGAVRHWTTGIREISVTTTRLIKMFDKYPTLLKEF
jgi:DNA-binding transcriptional regulator YiaG